MRERERAPHYFSPFFYLRARYVFSRFLSAYVTLLEISLVYLRAFDWKDTFQAIPYLKTL